MSTRRKTSFGERLRWLAFGQGTLPQAQGTKPVPTPRIEEIAEQPDGFLFGGMGLAGNAPAEKWRGEKLIQRQGWDIYRRMTLDETIRSALEMGIAGVCAREWDFEIAEKDNPQAEQVRDVLLAGTRELRGSIRGLVGTLMEARVEGFAPVEKIYGTCEYEGRAYWCLRGYKLRPAHTFTVDVDRFGNTAGIWQLQGSGQRAALPPDKFIWFVNQQQYDAHYGRSDLQGCYNHYFAKSITYKLWDIFNDRAAAGAVVISAPSRGTENAASLSPAEKTHIQNILTNWAQTNGLQLPRGWEAEIIVPPNQEAFERRVKQADKAIARALLLPGLSGFAEQGETGSYSQAQTQLDIWFFALDTWCDAIAEALNEQLFRPLVEWNFGPGVACQRFFFHKLTAAQKAATAAAWQKLVEAGAVMNTFEDELFTRSLLGYPERSEDAQEAGGMEQQQPLDMPPLGQRPMDRARGTLATSASEAPFDAAKVEAALYGKQGKLRKRR